MPWRPGRRSGMEETAVNTTKDKNQPHPKRDLFTVFNRVGYSDSPPHFAFVT